jgi:hypothetical protein
MAKGTCEMAFLYVAFLGILSRNDGEHQWPYNMSLL